ncbi:tissue factor pathway inhibitor 2 [Monodelphis domestica]|uniref:tissue factor pathway inhibitor 2 n=1 Tax=Monodelphis domestica TaxID=13616 RepID=UPI0024E1AA6C|nr:tissue factor pathway inhibitor 2 [Monodelphis domestica]
MIPLLLPLLLCWPALGAALPALLEPPPPPPSSPCLQPRDDGSCQGLEPHLQYALRLQKCLSLLFRGCEGKANNFDSVEACERECGWISRRNQQLPATSREPEKLRQPSGNRGTSDRLDGAAAGSSLQKRLLDVAQSILEHLAELRAPEPPSQRTRRTRGGQGGLPDSWGSISRASHPLDAALRLPPRDPQPPRTYGGGGRSSGPQKSLHTGAGSKPRRTWSAPRRAGFRRGRRDTSAHGRGGARP